MPQNIYHTVSQLAHLAGPELDDDDDDDGSARWPHDNVEPPLCHILVVKKVVGCSVEMGSHDGHSPG